MGVVREIVEPGKDGVKVKKGDKLYIHYRGTLASNGKQFDNSRDRGKPLEFKIGEGKVIRGWEEGIIGMKLGEKAKLNVSADYGYGAKGFGGGLIPPNSDLIFEVELVQINKTKM